LSYRTGKQRRAIADWVIAMALQSDVQAADRPYLYVAELLHRVHNEYTCAISLATRLAARSSHEETKTALAQIINRLHAMAASHQMLRPPLTTAPADLSANLAQLCHAMTSSGLAERDIELHLAVIEPVMLDAKRCWRAELIISELITNASRHAFTSQAGRISVTVETAAGQIICRVSDDGSPTATLKRGLGSELIDALAADLDGYVERIHKALGTTITLYFPQDLDEPPTVSLQEVKHAYSQSRPRQDATVAS
jgi:two-component sensor histidine kinase